MSSPPSSSTGDNPPYYILVSQAPVPSAPSGSGPSYKSFSHPIIQYHYADDVPNMLLPQSPQEQVLILDYDPSNMTVSIAQSLSPDIAVVGVKVTEPPAASSTTDDCPNLKSNDMIYVIETTTTVIDTPPEEQDNETVHSLVSRFKQRNAVLRAALEYPESQDQEGTTNPNPNHALNDPFRMPQS